MRVQDYRSASDEQRSLILSQAELRLGDQHAFAQAADARAATVTSAAAGLATASVGALAVSLSEGPSWPLAAGSLVATVGFALAARKALDSARCREFHPKGYRPSDFAEDIRTAKSVEDTRSEMAEDFDERLTFNSQILIQRGDLIDAAMSLMWKTPGVAALMSMIVALISQVLKSSGT